MSSARFHINIRMLDVPNSNRRFRSGDITLAIFGILAVTYWSDSMKLKSILSSVVLLVFVTGCGNTLVNEKSLAESSENTQAALVPEVEENGRSTKVCKEYRPTGSRIGKKVCRPKGEWEEIERTAQQRLDNITKPQTNNPAEGK